MIEHWNPPNMLPPVDCPLIIRLGVAPPDPGPYLAVHCERTSHIESRGREMTYKSSSTGQIWTGRYWWTYP